MRQIDLQTWPRHGHFKLFSSMGYPHFSLCVNVEVTAFYSYVKQHGISFNVALVYVLARAANNIPEFRHRIRDGEVVEHEIVHPSTTILGKDDLFNFCTFEYFDDFSVFAPRASERIDAVKEDRVITDEPGRDDLLYMTAIPWVSFTSFMHPIPLNPADSVPRFAWGKFFEEGELFQMPLSVQGHHALMDGLHASRYYAEVQEYFRQPGSVLGGV